MINSCCKRFLQWSGDQSQSILCKNWILPIRLTVGFSLFGHLLWWIFHPVMFYTAIIVAIHGFVAVRLLFECRRSERYYRTIEEFGRREASFEE